MARQVNIPPQYSSRVGGDGINWRTITIDAASDFMAARELVKYGIPYAAANSFSAREIPGTGAEGITALETISPKTGRSLTTQATGANLGSGLEEGSGEAAGRIRRFGGEDGIFGGEEASDTGFANPTNAFDPTQVGLGTGKNITKGQRESKRKALAEGQIPMGESQGFTEEQFNPNSGLSTIDQIFATSGFKTAGDDSSQSSFGGDMDVDSVIAMFFEGGKFGDAVINDPETGIEQLNPLLAQLLDQADMQGGRISDQQIAQIQKSTAVQVAQFQKSEAISVAQREGITGKALASINTKSDERIATAQALADQAIATTQAGAITDAATTNAEAQKNIAGTQGVTDVSVATIGAGGQLGAAEAAAGAASPFGFMNQGGNETDLASIYEQLNEVGLAEAAARESQAGAANVAAQNNAFSFAAGQGDKFNQNQIAQLAANSAAGLAAGGQTESARLQSEAQTAIAQIQSSVGLDQNNKEYQIAQIVDQTQRAVAAIQGGSQQNVAQAQAGGQIGAAQAGASGFGALLSGNAGVNQQANEILRAQAANNAYGSAQLGQDQSRIDQILRGGLSADQRLAEINAGQSGQNFANQLNFMSNPSAVGFATEQGLFGGQNNQVLQDINNSPEGNVPGSLFGFNSPSPAGAGGNQTTNTGNFNANTLRNASDEQIGFLQGAASAGGQTPSEFNQQVESFTPQGY